MERLQKRIAQSGVASRRKSEELIASGRVKVNGKTVTEMGFKRTSPHAHLPQGDYQECCSRSSCRQSSCRSHSCRIQKAYP